MTLTPRRLIARQQNPPTGERFVASTAPPGSAAVSFLGQRRWLTLFIPLTLALLAGCGQELDTIYGRSSGAIGGKSVNGTSVLADMFRQAGHRVHTWRYLSPRLNEADVIVWAPNDFEPPTPEVRQWLESWLQGDSHGDDWGAPSGPRTLIYIGRDFDSAPLYWQATAPIAPPDKTNEFRQRFKEAKADESFLRSDLPSSGDYDWFTLDSTPLPRAVTTLEGPWAKDIDSSQVEMKLGALLEPPPGDDDEILLSSNEDTLVSRSKWGSNYYYNTDYYDGTMIVVANGSFLLNYQLINHEHRKLAGKLVDAVGPPELNVVFLESESGGPPIRDKDPETSVPSWLHFFTVWPINIVVLHLALLGVIFCFARWPIFGLARELPSGGTSDFGKHIKALGQLLAKTGDRGYAGARLSQYEQHVRGENPPDVREAKS